MIRQISVGNLCGELGEMLIHFQYSSDSLRRYNRYSMNSQSTQEKGNTPSSWELLSAPLPSITTSV